jgi:hypothetical protein
MKIIRTYNRMLIQDNNHFSLQNIIWDQANEAI